VHVQVAADLLQLDERRRRARKRRLAQLGRNVAKPERGEHAFLVRRVRQRAERLDELGRARRAHELRAEPLRLGDYQLDRHSLERDANGAIRSSASHYERQTGRARYGTRVQETWFEGELLRSSFVRSAAKPRCRREANLSQDLSR
jgi:hypothetical protein